MPQIDKICSGFSGWIGSKISSYEFRQRLCDNHIGKERTQVHGQLRTKLLDSGCFIQADIAQLTLFKCQVQAKNQPPLLRTYPDRNAPVQSPANKASQTLA